MPFLRVIRDKRGYETTYLMHWFREGNRQHSRVLYVFRTPGGVRVGRAPLDPEVLRQIEAQHPEIDFDWPAVLDNRQVVEPSPEQRRPRKRRREDEGAAPVPVTQPAAAPETQPSAPQPRLVVPSTIEGDTPDAQIEFLNRWYPVLRDYIGDRTADPGRREILLALAQRIDPSAWTDADQITAGLQQAAEALERLSRVFSRRRRRPRRGPRGAEPAGATEAAASSSADRSDSDSSDSDSSDSDTQTASE